MSGEIARFNCGVFGAPRVQYASAMRWREATSNPQTGAVQISEIIWGERSYLALDLLSMGRLWPFGFLVSSCTLVQLDPDLLSSFAGRMK